MSFPLFTRFLRDCEVVEYTLRREGNLAHHPLLLCAPTILRVAGAGINDPWHVLARLRREVLGRATLLNQLGLDLLPSQTWPTRLALCCHYARTSSVGVSTCRSFDSPPSRSGILSAPLPWLSMTRKWRVGSARPNKETRSCCAVPCPRKNTFFFGQVRLVLLSHCSHLKSAECNLYIYSLVYHTPQSLVYIQFSLYMSVPQHMCHSNQSIQVAYTTSLLPAVGTFFRKLSLLCT